MNSICAYFDCQGFYARGVFWPRELAWLDDSKTCHYRVELGTIEDLFSEKERKSAYFLQKYHHGMELGKAHGILGSVKVCDAIKDCFDNILSLKDRVAVKSKEAEEFLDYLGIDSINLLAYGGTAKKINDGSLPVCSLHSSECRNAKCSLATVKYMQKYVENKTKIV